ncbi:MAG TPA: CXXX repeat peptide modification system protein [Paludibacteraceae bacterium]|jgi:CXXX repeat modification system protein|nr:CXXX repeat peptide modification system protein [Bacteroidales bacterium]HRR62582.1 CXXX repeat peptide modification system protein [Paludibacteraceae bacterium]
MRKIIGKVTETERNEIMVLYERKNGLSELIKIINPDDAIYEKLVTDMGSTSTKFQKWWDTMSSKYQWESVGNGHWEIDFESCDILLVS